MDSSEFQISIDWNEAKRVAILGLEGQLDAHTFQLLEKTFENHFAEDKYRIIVDLSKLHYVSSAGCGQFIAAASDAKNKGGMVVFINASESVSASLQVIGILDVLPAAPNLEAALAMFK